jgi:hypothetical protein
MIPQYVITRLRGEANDILAGGAKFQDRPWLIRAAWGFMKQHGATASAGEHISLNASLAETKRLIEIGRTL